MAENACHQAILGQTLTSDTSDNGGSRAQAEVHLGVQKAVVMKRAEYVARVLNRQLVPAIIAMNYGKLEGVPMPEIKFAMPDEGANIERAAYWAQVLAIPGVRVAKETIYESLRLPIPGDNEDTLGGSSAPSDALKNAAPGKDDDEPDDDPDPDKPRSTPADPPAEDDVKGAAADAPAASTDSAAERALRDWGAPVREKLRQWLTEGVPLREIRARLRELRPDTTALATALSNQFRAGLQDDNAEAANPYGCGPSGHTDKCPNDGTPKAPKEPENNSEPQDNEKPQEEQTLADKLSAIEPVEVNFTPRKRRGADWVADAQRHFMANFAGRSFAIGDTGHTLHVGDSKSRARLATKGTNTQKRNESFKVLEDVISRSVHISSEDPQAKEGQGHHKAAIMAKTATFEKYGAPATINGEKNLIWFNAQTKKKGDKDVLFYEFGVTPL